MVVTAVLSWWSSSSKSLLIASDPSARSVFPFDAASRGSDGAQLRDVVGMRSSVQGRSEAQCALRRVASIRDGLADLWFRELNPGGGTVKGCPLMYHLPSSTAHSRNPHRLSSGGGHGYCSRSVHSRLTIIFGLFVGFAW